jgi:hypothetical protein
MMREVAIRMIRSGIAPLDTQYGGVTPGRIHLLTGGVGTGKTSACLHFIAAGLDAGDRAAILTLDTPEELGSHAAYLGIDFEPPLRDGRLIALRFRPEFARRLAASPSVEWVADDLRRMLARLILPGRIAIDPVSPFLADGSPIGAGIAAVVDLLDRFRSTSLLTYPGPLTDGADRRLDPLVERAATVAALSRHSHGQFAISVVRARLAEASGTPIPFTIGRDVGLTGIPGTSDEPGVLAYPAHDLPLRAIDARTSS